MDGVNPDGYGATAADTIAEAAALLEAQAELQRESCQIGVIDWACADCHDKEACPSRQTFARLSNSAAALRALIGPAAQEAAGQTTNGLT